MSANQLRTQYLEDGVQTRQSGEENSRITQKNNTHRGSKKDGQKHGWYLKQYHKDMVDHLLVPSFKVTEVTTFIFFLIIPNWIYNMETQDKLYWQVNNVATFKDHTDNIKKNYVGRSLLAICWIVCIRSCHLQNNWKREIYPLC